MKAQCLGQCSKGQRSKYLQEKTGRDRKAGDMVRNVERELGLISKSSILGVVKLDTIKNINCKASHWINQTVH